MNPEMAMTKNVRRLMAAVNELTERPMGVEGLGVLWGQPGEGKTETITFIANQVDGIVVEARRTWSILTMLQTIGFELELPKLHRMDPMFESVVGRLAEKPRAIFLDEADYLTKNLDLLDVLRSIYDRVKVPVFFVGMEDFARKIQRRERFARRITQWVHFSGIDLDDARTVSNTVCQVDVSQNLLAHVHKASKANIGRMITAFARIQRHGRTTGAETVTLEQWGERELFFDQPVFRRKP